VNKIWKIFSPKNLFLFMQNIESFLIIIQEFYLSTLKKGKLQEV